MNELDVALLVGGYMAVAVLTGAVLFACDEQMEHLCVVMVMGFWPLAIPLFLLMCVGALMVLSAYVLGDQIRAACSRRKT